jgi:hypothetical protein
VPAEELMPATGQNSFTERRLVLGHKNHHRTPPKGCTVVCRATR